MKRISSRFSMAVHILTFISLSPSACTSDWIAESVGTNPVVVRKLTGMLKKAGFLSVRAGTGGAYLEKSLSTITLLDVYRAVEVVEADDLFRIHDLNLVCPVGASLDSILRLVLLRAQTAMEQVLSQVTLQDLVNEVGDKISSSSS